MLRVALKGAWAHRFRFLATGLGVVLGVAFVTGALVLTDTIGTNFDDLFARVHAGKDAVVRRRAAISFAFGDARGRVDAAVLERVRRVPGVAYAEGEVDGFAQIVGRDGEPLGTPGEGPPTLGVSWPAHDTLNPLVLVEGREPRSAREVVVDKRSADLGHLEVGAPVTVLTKQGPARLTLVGIARFGDADSPLGASITAFTPEAAQRLVGQPGRFSQIAVVAEEGVSASELRERLVAVVPEGHEVLTGNDFIADQRDEIQEGLSFFRSFLLIFGGIALFVGTFAIHNTFSITLAQRTREVALLRAVGASRTQVLRAVLAEAGLLGLGAGVVGVGAGLLIAAGLKGLLAALGLDVPAGGLVFRPRTALVALGAGLGATVFSALFPARRAARVPPVALLREVALDAGAVSRSRAAAGTVVLLTGASLLAGGLVAGGALVAVGAGAALVFLGVAGLGPFLARPLSRVLGAPLPRLRGVPGTLARENTGRNPRRTAATAASLMVGVGLVGAIVVLAASFKASVASVIEEKVRADLVVEPPSFGMGGLSPDLAHRLEALPEVGAAVGVRSAPAEVDGDATLVQGADVTRLGRVLDLGVSRGDLAALDEGSIAVEEDVAGEEGWRLGDTVEVTFAETGRRRFRLAAVYEEGAVVGSTLLGLPAFEANVADQFDSRVFVRRAPGVEASAARAAVEGVAARFPNARVRDLEEFKASQVGQVDRLVGLVYALLALALVIGFLGIGNALALAVFERTRELGLLRAVGMTRGQVRASVRWESVLVSLIGTVVGLAIGVVFAWGVTAAIGEASLRVPVGQIVVVMVVAGFAGVLAAAGPARRAARLDVVEAVTTE